MPEFSLYPDPKDQIQIGETVLCLPIGVYAQVREVVVLPIRNKIEARYVLEGIQAEYPWLQEDLQRQGSYVVIQSDKLERR